MRKKITALTLCIGIFLTRLHFCGRYDFDEQRDRSILQLFPGYNRPNANPKACACLNAGGRPDLL